MKTIIIFFNKISFQVFCLSLFLIRLPPLYVLPITSAFLNSHSIARYLLIALMIFSLLSLYSKNLYFKLDKKLSILILSYFISHSLSVVTAVNIPEFLLRYKDIVFSLVIFYLAILILDSKNKIENLIKVLMLTVIINTFLEFLIYFYPSEIFPFLQNFAYGQYWDTLMVNFRRQRFFIDIYDAALIPFFLYYLYKNKRTYLKLTFIFIIAAVYFFTLVSNFRSLFLMSVFSILVGSFILMRNKFRNKLLPIVQLSILIFFLYIGYRVTGGITNITALDRLITPTEGEYATLTTRWFFWTKSVDMAMSSPIFGIGLGNFYDHLPSLKKSIFTIYPWRAKLFQISYSHPHSIFFGVLAETGLLGLISLIVLLIYFLISDSILFKRSLLLLQMSIVGFWSLFIYAIVNPPVTLQYLSLFWLFRALIYKLHTLSN